MQAKLLQFKLQKVWILVDLPSRKKAIGIKWVFKNKRDERSIVSNKQSSCSNKGLDRKRNRLWIEEVYVHQPPGFVDPAYQNKVYKVIKALHCLHQAPRAWYETLSSFLMENGFRIEFEDCMHKRFQMRSIDELTFFLGLQVKQQPDGIFICQDKYIADILKKFDYWDSPFELEAFSDSDYGGASLDRKSTIGGCQFFGRRLISWQCKKQTIMANSTTKAKYVATANCCGQVLWIQNQMMDYCFNFMNTRIHIDNESTISVIKNPVAHSRTKHIKIRFHFIRDCYEKRLIEVIKIHTDSNVADLLTKEFDVIRFKFLMHVPVPLDHFPINALTTKVFYFMVKKGKKISKNVTPLFPSMLAQPTEDEGAFLERPSEIQPTPSPTHPSEDQSEPQPDPFLRPSSSNPIPTPFQKVLVGIMEVTTQATQIKDLKAQIKQLKKKAKPVISHHNAWIKCLHEEKIGKEEVFEDKVDAERVLKDNEETRVRTDRPKVSTDKLKIDPKDKGKKVLKEKAKSEGVNEAERKFSQLANDEEIARKYDFIQARLNADKILADKLQEEEREKFTIEQRAKHARLNKKKFEEIQVTYEKVKRENENFITIGFAKDEKLIEKMNKKAAGMDKEEVSKEFEIPEEEEKIDYEVLGTRYPIINWESKFYDYGHFGRELIYYKVFRTDGSSRWIKTFSEMIKLFDRIESGFRHNTRFIEKQIDEFGGQDGNEEDL
ncbi:putative ribonuclease H-like domain-containing protein [Tanacetum coccineum]